jgi:hypothetical protein
LKKVRKLWVGEEMGQGRNVRGRNDPRRIDYIPAKILIDLIRNEKCVFAIILIIIKTQK